ncbi:ArdC family protein [Flavobacteriaceae bacterium]|nr:ArdC family protein [Flavobacteriaceae bacterium]MDA8807460.1 ArdC family protein [Flavobacteriaceae bacterium]MDB2413425.1 ArdC family protein [Flavobacteriaceae bacterium]
MRVSELPTNYSIVSEGDGSPPLQSENQQKLKIMNELKIKKTKPHISIESKKPYKGENHNQLDYVSRSCGYKSNEWGTFLSWKKIGRGINKGEKGTLCFYPTSKKTNKLDKEGNPKVIRIRKYFKLFNKNQTSTIKITNTQLLSLV